jgi:hypothetical protein
VVGILVLSGAVAMYQQMETIPPQPATVAQVEGQMKRQMRRGWLRVLLYDRTLEVRVNGEAVLGYTGKSPRLEDVDTAVVRGIALKALDLYAPPRFGAAPGLDSVRIRLRHTDRLGPINWRTRGRDYTWSTTALRP